MLRHPSYFINVLSLFVLFTLQGQEQGTNIVNNLDEKITNSVRKIDRLGASTALPEQQSKNVSLLPENPFAGLPLTVKPYGYVKSDYYWDTRQVFGKGEDHALFWPLRKLLDPCGKDINDHPKFQFTAIETRVGFLIRGPNIGTRKKVGASAIIEGDFFGLTENLINQFRMRHAFLRLDFEESDSHLIFGQFWHPLFQPDCFPRSLSFNLGVPFDTVSRQPQIRYTKNFANGHFIIGMMSQRDFQSFGPFGFTTMYMRNSKTPNFAADFRINYGNENFIGASIDFKRLAPRIVSNSGYAVKEYVHSVIAQGYVSNNFGRATVNIKGIYAQNATDFNMVSGYAVKCVTPITDFRTYVPTSCFSVWTDAFYVADYPCGNFQIEYGIFVGGTKNLGANQALYIDPVLCTPIVYSYDPTILYAWRVSPRILFKKFPVRFGAEFETTGASFGKLDSHARVYDAEPVHNFRFCYQSKITIYHG